MKFKRKLDQYRMDDLKKEELFNKMKDDISNGKVFPAIRDNSVDFYYKGGNLFSYESKDFSTHQKYASVIVHKNDYIKQSKLKDVKIINNFVDGYKSIKENCAIYAGAEAEGVSNLYHKYSFAKKNLKSNIVVLDIEISFSDELSKKRIDILLFNKETKTLRFYEAKHYTNPDLWSKENTLPKVRNQVENYLDTINSQKDEIIQQYKEYVNIVNELFNVRLPIPEKIDPTPLGLLIFGYDSFHIKKINQLLINDGSLEDIPFYTVGNMGNVFIKNLWKRTKAPKSFATQP